MKRYLTIAAGLIASATLMMVATPAMAHVDVDFNIGVPGIFPPDYEQPRSVYVEPEPVYVQPEPVYVQQEPGYVEQEPVYVEQERDREWGERHIRGRQWKEQQRQEQHRREDRRDEHRDHDD